MEPTLSSQDRLHLARAIELAQRGWGRVHPNPLVGCVVVKNGVRVGEGWHKAYGEPHAEVHALLEAGEQAGLNLAYGCRIGICHPCVGTLKSGRIRDLRSGEVTEPTGQDLRICIHAPEGDIALEL